VEHWKEGVSLWVGSGLTHKAYIRLERLARDERCNLLSKVVTRDLKKFYNIGPCSDDNIA
jgi:hypothetical protein